MVATVHHPWLRRNDWAVGRVEYRHSSWPAVAHSWFMGLGWIVMVAMAGRLILRDFNTLSRDARIGWPVFVIVLLAVGIYLLREAIRETRQKRCGRSVFEMARVPAVPGGRLDGVIHAHAIKMSSADVQVTLACGPRCHRPSGTQSRTGDWMVPSRSGYPEDSYDISTVQWTETQRIDRGRLVESGTGVGIPVSFAIPTDLPPTDLFDLEENGNVAWRVVARIPSTGYYARFYVPVFKTADAETELALAPPPARPARSEPVRQPVESKIKVLPTEHGVVIQVQGPVNLMLWTVVPSLVLVALAWPVSHLPALADMPFPVVLGAASALAALVLLLNVIVLPAVPTRIEIGGGTLTIQSGLGPIGKARIIPIAEIDAVRPFVVGGNNYSVRVYTKDGAGHTSLLAGHTVALLRGADQAQWLAAEIGRYVGL